MELADQIMDDYNSKIDGGEEDNIDTVSNVLELSSTDSDSDEQKTDFKETFDSNMEYFGGQNFFADIFGDENDSDINMGGDSSNNADTHNG